MENFTVIFQKINLGEEIYIFKKSERTERKRDKKEREIRKKER